MKYKLKGIYNGWMVVEIKTDHVLAFFTDKEEARKELRRLNFGAVFDGWTPAFFLKNLNFNQKNLAS
jgi:hypothetical protein